MQRRNSHEAPFGVLHALFGTIVFFAFLAPANATPGIAFHLTPNYGTAAAHFENGTSVAVARIEGSSAYKTLLRRTRPLDSTQNPPKSAKGVLCSIYDAVTPTLVQAYFDYCPVDDDHFAIKSLLRDLKTATETHLGHGICFADIVVPSRIAADYYLHRVIDEARHDVGLSKIRRQHMEAWSMALASNGLFDDDAPPSMYLVVDYSEHGMNLDLAFLEDGIPETIRRHHNSTMTLTWGEPVGGVMDEPKPLLHPRSVLAAIENILESPFSNDRPTWLGELPDEIAGVVLYGDLTHDASFREDLAAVLGEHQAANAFARQPIYAPALGSSDRAFTELNDPWPNGDSYPAIFGCCWRSGGLGCPTPDGSNNWKWEFEALFARPREL